MVDEAVSVVVGVWQILHFVFSQLERVTDSLMAQMSANSPEELLAMMHMVEQNRDVIYE